MKYYSRIESPLWSRRGNPGVEAQADEDSSVSKPSD